MAAVEKSNLLVVDDNEVSRYSRCRILRQAGFDVVEAASGSETLRAVETTKPRLVLLDVNLPDINGWEVCRRIKADPATASVLVLQISATYVQQSDTVRALEGGADACLTEPVEPGVLLATVRALLRARVAEDAMREALAREKLARATAEAANHSKDEFLATLSHELRSPLGAILNWTTLLRRGALDGPQTERALESIERNARHQVKLIEDLLDVSRIVTGKMRLDLKLVDPVGIVEAALEVVRPAAEAKGVALAASLAAGVGPIVADTDRLQQVVFNLLSNAVKFTPRDGRVEVQLERAGSSARITVGDTGQGIAPEVLPHVFERFRQADPNGRVGLGLGLAIVRHLIELHGGTVSASSPGIGGGATFVLDIPLPAVPATAAYRNTRARDLGVFDVPALHGVHLLIVDDDADAREAVTAVLDETGASTSAVGSVAEAIASIERVRPDAIVSDITLPDADGYELIRLVRAMPAGRGDDIPALALTGHARAEDQRRVLAAGYQGYLVKPIEPVELLTALANLVARPPGR
jgi:signal transduction histidine kinase